MGRELPVGFGNVFRREAIERNAKAGDAVTERFQQFARRYGDAGLMPHAVDEFLAAGRRMFRMAMKLWRTP